MSEPQVTVERDGHPQSYVDPDDPLLLVFEYVQQFALVLEALRPDPAPLAVTHVGGAGMTLARWVHRVHPGSPQIVLEPDVAGSIIEGLDPSTPHTVTVEVHPEQPDRSPVAFRLKDPETELKSPKYQGTNIRVGQILLLGDLVE